MKPKIAPKELQPESFEFSKESQKEVEYHLKKYPEGHKMSAVMPMLDIAQRQEGWWRSERMPSSTDESTAIIDVTPKHVD